MIALAAVGVGGVGLGLYNIRPRDPVFEVQAITLSGFNLRFCTDSPLLLAVVDVSLTLFIKVINPNVTPIQFSSTIMDIYYKGNLLGQAQVCVCFVSFRCYCYCRCCFCLRLARLIGFGAALCIWIIALYFVLFICSRWRIVHVWETSWTRHMFQMRNYSCLRNLLDKAYVPDDLFLVCFIWTVLMSCDWPASNNNHFEGK